MRYRFAGVALFPVLLTVVAATTLGTAHAPAANTRSDPDGLIAHEWGTFTSIADRDGQAVDWLPTQGPVDLPCFVNRLRIGVKGILFGTVRMETPVLYFYSPVQTTVKVNVRFPKGVVSEWFPKAKVTPATIDPADFSGKQIEGGITWPEVTVSPRSSDAFPTEAAKNHYYAARATDAAPLAVGDEREKFLFYRGVGRFQPPIRATVRADGQIDVENADHRPLGDLVLFENRSGVTSFSVVRASGDRFTFDAVSPRGDREHLYASLERLLVSAGLYQKEAAAMVETWRDSWFEEGARLLYIVPKESVEAILPLDISPRPKEVSRVFVGRVELLTSRTLSDMKTALQTSDRAMFKTYGRFFESITQRLRADLSPAELPAFQTQLQRAYDSGALSWNVSSCR